MSFDKVVEMANKAANDALDQVMTLDLFGGEYVPKEYLREAIEKSCAAQAIIQIIMLKSEDTLTDIQKAGFQCVVETLQGKEHGEGGSNDN